MSTPNTPVICPAAAARQQRRLAGPSADSWLQTQMAQRLAQRLAVLRQAPQQVLDWSIGGGHVSPQLRQACPDARIIRVQDPPISTADSLAAKGAFWRRWLGRGGARAAHTPSSVLGSADVPDEAADLVWSTLMLCNHAEPTDLLRRWCQALRPGGFLMCATLGPGSFAPLQSLYDQAGWGPAAAPQPDLLTLGDAMLRAGLADPVVDQVTLWLSYTSPHTLLSDLRAIGGNLDANRFSGWRTARWRARLLEGLAGMAADDGRIHMPVEIVFGHALNQPRTQSGQEPVGISLQQLRAQLPSRRTG